MTVAEPRSRLEKALLPLGKKRSSAAGIVSTRQIHPLDGSEWDRLASAHPSFSFFHSSAWAKVLHRTYGHEPLYFAVEKDGEIVALVPVMEVRSAFTGHRGVCLPFTDACPPLYFGQAGTGGLVFDHLQSLARQRQWRHFEVRGDARLPADPTPSTSFHSHILDLRKGPGELLRQVASSVRTALNKARRHGVNASVRTDPEATIAFYHLHCQTRKRHGLPPQSLSFFLNLHQQVIEAGLGFIVLAQKDSQPVAGAVFFYSGRKALYKFGASDASQQELRGSNSAMWKGIEVLSERGYESLDFGRTSLANHGLRRFKLSWGSEESLASYFQFDTSRQMWTTAPDHSTGLHTHLFRNLPLSLNRLAGTLLYPHLD